MICVKALLYSLIALPAALACSDSTSFTWNYTHGTTKYTHHCSFLSNGDESTNEKRRNNWCSDNKVKNNCKKSCDNCGDDPSPPNDKCTDTKKDWKDVKGFDCKWYGAEKSRCTQYGNKRFNDGGKANDFCCVCGGGKKPAMEA
mmetsp:Transcript_9224/g.11563  ORF Transcript_9224/g.11563 Transcript_9224/m.11563 type:complete len:144 (-) Transcript_9224:231-662(-)